jgi:hypothetical protein
MMSSATGEQTSTQVVVIFPLDASQIAGTSADARILEQGFFGNCY